ncbi:MAG: CD225/dispanin family protein [Aquihabitans sp.]
MTTPANWYPNPEDPGTERWWDGAAWTDATRPVASWPAPTPPPPNFGASGGAPGYQPPGQGYAPPGPGYPAHGQAQWGGGAGKPENGLVVSILVTLFCCLPFGVVAIVNSAKVDSLWNSGDAAGAHQAAAEAKRWTNYAAIAGLIVGVGYFLVAVLGTSSSSGY